MLCENARPEANLNWGEVSFPVLSNQKTKNHNRK